MVMIALKKKKILQQQRSKPFAFIAQKGGINQLVSIGLSHHNNLEQHNNHKRDVENCIIFVNELQGNF